MYVPKPITEKNPGDPILADEFNQLVQRLCRLEKMTVGKPLSIQDNVNNPTIVMSDWTLSKRFQLLEDLNRGDTADANQVWNDSYGNWVIDTDTIYTVYDPFEIYTGSSGDRGYAIQRPDSSDFWEIIRLQHIANWIYFRVIDPFNMMEETLEVDVVEYWDGYSPEAGGAQGSSSSSSGLGNTLIYNLRHSNRTMWEFHGQADLVGYATYDNIRKHYRLIQLQCTLQSSSSGT